MGVHGDYLRGASRAAGRMAGVTWSPMGGARGAAASRGPQRGLFSMAAGAGTPINMLVSQQKKISCGRLCAISLGLFTLLVGVLLSSIPWLDYMIQKVSPVSGRSRVGSVSSVAPPQGRRAQRNNN
ncbi:hypothetical protein ONE63_003829 [Megalurothrips usitatus]|uniref:Uncharacterized protein n=1 Tax=Megalurothrips usitatus TaxID=439358 RepID=A0AAV7X487_9NEOP|nr:hypothetical protein ONE63_003829 [Megalurothrips usitatus]